MKQFAFILSILSLSACSWFEPHYTSGLEGQTLPDFNLTKNNTTPIHISDFTKGQPFLIFLYRPTCAFCNAQIQDIISHIADFNNTQIYLITSNSYTSIKRFSDIYHLERYSNVILLRDSSNHIMNYFKAPVVPYTAFYDRDNKLKRVIIGKNDFKLIKNSLEHCRL